MRRLALLLPLLLVCSLAVPARAATVVTWHMDDLNGTSDPSGHTIDPNSGVSESDDDYWTFAGKGLAKTGGDDDALDPGSSTFTVSVRVRTSTMPSSSVGDYDLVRKGLSNTSGGYWKLELIPNGTRTRTVALCQMTGGTLRWAPYTLDDGEWHTVSCTRTSSSLILKIDGKTRSKTDSTGSISNGSALYVGAKSSNADRYVGDMDELSISVG